MLYIDELDDDHWLTVMLLQIVLYDHDQVVTVLYIDELDENRWLTVTLLQIVSYDHDQAVTVL